MLTICRSEEDKPSLSLYLSFRPQAGLAASIGGDFSSGPSVSADGKSGEETGDSATIEQLQDRIIQLEQELIDEEEKYEEQLEMEKVGFTFTLL